MAELSPVLSLVLGYWESSLVGPVYDRDHQGFQHESLGFGIGCTEGLCAWWLPPSLYGRRSNICKEVPYYGVVLLGTSLCGQSG